MSEFCESNYFFEFSRVHLGNTGRSQSVTVGTVGTVTTASGPTKTPAAAVAARRVAGYACLSGPRTTLFFFANIILSLSYFLL